MYSRHLTDELPYLKEEYSDSQLEDVSYFLRKKVAVLFDKVILNKVEYKGKIGEEKYNIADELLLKHFIELDEKDSE